MMTSESRMDESGDLIENQTKIGDKVSIHVEGQRYNGEVVAISQESSVSDIQLKVETDCNNLIILFVDILQRTPQDSLDHYKTECYAVHNNERRMSYIGLLTKLTKN